MGTGALLGVGPDKQACLSGLVTVVVVVVVPERTHRERGREFMHRQAIGIAIYDAVICDIVIWQITIYHLTREN